jgi:hypothetical protein
MFSARNQAKCTFYLPPYFGGLACFVAFWRASRLKGVRNKDNKVDTVQSFKSHQLVTVDLWYYLAQLCLDYYTRYKIQDRLIAK